jgi:hypothetical protein
VPAARDGDCPPRGAGRSDDGAEFVDGAGRLNRVDAGGIELGMRVVDDQM